MFAAFFAGPIGAIAGFILGVWLPLRAARQALVPRGARLFGAVDCRGGRRRRRPSPDISISTMPRSIATARASRSNSRSGCRRTRRLPAQMRDIRIELDTAKNTITGDLDPSETRKDGERTVLVGEVELYFRTSSRTLALQIPGEPDRIFKLPLAASPRPFEEFTRLGARRSHRRAAGPSAHGRLLTPPTISTSATGCPIRTSRSRTSSSKSGCRPARGCRRFPRPAHGPATG